MAGDAINFIKADPGLYLTSVKQGFWIYFHSSSDYLLFKERPTLALESWWDRIFYGQLKTYEGDFKNRWKDDPAYVGWLLVIVYLAAIFQGLKIAFNRDWTPRDVAGVAAFMTFTILYFTVMANFLDLGENNRFRFAIDPLALVLFGVFLQNAILLIWKKARP
jgi:hypothetical protein